MPTTPPQKPADPRSPLSVLTWVSLSVAGLMVATWLWSCWCSFPSNPWNDIRVAPAIALHHGISIYSTAGAGPVSTWIYGPVPLLLLWPAGLASTASGAIQIAGAIHIGLRVLGIVLVCLYWPVGNPAVSSVQHRQRRLVAALVAILVAKADASSGYLVFGADSPAVFFALLSLLALSHRHYWLAAAGVAAAIACKQTILGMFIAEVLWLALALSVREAGRFALRCLLMGTTIALISISCFGAAGLWHTMVDLPSRFPSTDLVERLRYHQTYVGLYLAAPLLAMTVGRKFFFRRESPLLLPALAFLATLPLNLAGLCKVGGNLNALHGFWLWFPPVLVTVLDSSAFVRRGQSACLALATGSAILASLWLHNTPLRVRPNLQAYREAEFLAARMPGKIWFPMHPIVTLYSDGRFYHDYDGLLERVTAGQPLGEAQFFAHLPRDRKVTATLLPVGWGPADRSHARLPPDAPANIYGNWQLQGWPE